MLPQVFLLVASVASLASVALGAPAPDEAQKVACLAQLDQKFASILIPTQVSSFVESIRQLNPQQAAGSLVQLFEDSQMDRRVRETGLVGGEGQEAKLVQYCEALTKNALSVVHGDDHCNLATFSLDDGFLSSRAANYKNADNIYGSIMACMLV